MIRGYKEALSRENLTIFVKMDSDGQMDPSRICDLINPLLKERADYTKGTRFDSIEDLEQMPRIRILGNAVFSLITINMEMP